MSTTPVAAWENFHVPYFEVKIDGRPQEKAIIRDIIQVTFKDSLKEVDSFEITINNWDAEKFTFKYSDEDTFDPGKTLELWMGYYGNDRIQLMIHGEITSLRPTFPQNGQPTLVISGLSLLHQLRQKQRSHVYRDKKDSQIAEEVAKRLKADVKTDREAQRKEVKYAYLSQKNEYDVLFLLERGRRIGYDLYVIEEGSNGRSEKPCLFFGPTENLKRANYKLDYGKTLIQFQPTLNLSNQVQEVKVQSWNNVTKERITYTAKRKPIIINGKARFTKSFKKRQEVVNKPVADMAEARQLATETLKRIAQEMIKGSGSTVGLPDLRTGSLLEIKGLDALFNGQYFVTGTTHTISDSGYTTQFECRREDLV